VDPFDEKFNCQRLLRTCSRINKKENFEWGTRPFKRPQERKGKIMCNNNDPIKAQTTHDASEDGSSEPTATQELHISICTAI
jgi:hypothetical protein